MEENSSISFWKVAVTILLAAILIGVVFLIARQGKSVVNEKLEGVSGMLSEYQDESYAMYGGMEVSGAEVRNVIERACTKNDFVCVQVTTKAGSVTCYNYDYDSVNTKISQSADTDKYSDVVSTSASAGTYINPSAIFEGSVERDKNGVLIVVQFVQK